MKKILMFIAMLAVASTGYAKGWYIEPQVGYMKTIFEKYYNMEDNYSQSYNNSTMIINFGIGFTYKNSKLFSFNYGLGINNLFLLREHDSRINNSILYLEIGVVGQCINFNRFKLNYGINIGYDTFILYFFYNDNLNTKYCELALLPIPYVVFKIILFYDLSKKMSLILSPQFTYHGGMVKKSGHLNLIIGLRIF